MPVRRCRAVRRLRKSTESISIASRKSAAGSTVARLTSEAMSPSSSCTIVLISVSYHSFSGSCNSLPISARNNAPTCSSVTRWSLASVMVTTERGPIAPSTTQGRVTILPKPTRADLWRADGALEGVDAPLAKAGYRDRRLGHFQRQLHNGVGGDDFADIGLILFTEMPWPRKTPFRLVCLSPSARSRPGNPVQSRGVR